MDERVDSTENKALKSIGGTLLLARTEANLSQDDIAKRLNLSKTFIQYLENDEFDKLEQSPVFIRGYVRSYARMVNLQEEEMISLLNATGINEVVKPTNQYISTRMQITARDKKMRLVTYGIIILILALTFIWWHTRVSQHVDNKVLPAMSGNAQTAQPTVTQPKSNPTPSNVTTANIKSQLKMDDGKA